MKRKLKPRARQGKEPPQRPVSTQPKEQQLELEFMAELKERERRVTT